MKVRMRMFLLDSVRAKVESKRDLIEKSSRRLHYMLLAEEELKEEFKKIFKESDVYPDHIENTYIEDVYYYLLDKYHRLILADLNEEKHISDWSHPNNPEERCPFAPKIGTPESWFDLLDLSEKLHTQPDEFDELSKPIIDKIFESYAE